MIDVVNQRRICTATQLTRLCSGILFALVATQAWAQSAPQSLPRPAAPPPNTEVQPPPAQSLPQPSQPTMAETSFVLQAVHFSGNTLFSADELQQSAADKLGHRVGLADLNQIAQRVTGVYAHHGFYFARAIVPVQKVVNGVVEIEVIEGKLGRVNIDIASNAPLRASEVRAVLAPLQAGKPLDGREYERVMLLLSDIPGIRAQSTLQEGPVAGTEDLTVHITAAPRWSGSVSADDFGTTPSGRQRLGAAVRWASPFGIGDNLDLQAFATNHSGNLFGRLAYEAPVGGSGLRIGAGAARLNYSLGGAFAPLDATGTADIYDVALTYPLIRQRNENLFLRLAVDRKDLTDELHAVGFSSHKRVQGIGLGWAFERRDTLLGGGYFAASGVLYHGDLKLRDPAQQALDASVFGNHTAGSFSKLTFVFSRLQALPLKNNSLYLSLGGQLTDHNLDASEKLSLTGHETVQAYPMGEVLVDDGLIGTLEWRYAVRPDLTAYVFYDAARGRMEHSPNPFETHNWRNLRGPGLGLDWAHPGNFNMSLTVAWRNTAPVVSGGDGQPHIYWLLQKFF